MIIRSKSTYTSYVTRVTLIIFTGFIIVAGVKGNVAFMLALFIAIEMVFLATKFTEEIQLDSDEVKITWYLFLQKKSRVIARNAVGLKVSKKATSGGHGYLLLQVMSKGRQILEIDSRDGFSEKDLVELVRCFESESQ